MRYTALVVLCAVLIVSPFLFLAESSVEKARTLQILGYLLDAHLGLRLWLLVAATANLYR